ncbi:unnamed protein product [Ixodes hexagonus]
MAAVFSLERKSCADFFERHKRRIYRNRRFRYVTDLNVDALKMILPPSKAAALALDDMLCQNCFQYTGEKLSSSVSDPCSSSPASCIEEHEVVEGINKEISAVALETTPLRMPSTVNRKAVRHMLKENSGRLKDHTADRYEKSWRLHIPWSQVGQVLAVINHASAATGGG